MTVKVPGRLALRLGMCRQMLVLSSLIATIVMQPAGVFPFGFVRYRSEGTSDVVFVKDSRDKGTVLGQGSQLTQIPRSGGVAFVVAGSVPRVAAFDASGIKIVDEMKPGFVGVGRPAIDPFGNFMVVEFVGKEESEIWRIPLRGKGPSMMLSVINKGKGDANPALEMDSGHVWLNMGETWVLSDMKTAQTNSIDVKPLMDGLPNGTRVVEVRPSPSIPKQVAVSVILPSASQHRWVMVWDRQSNVVSRVSRAGANCDQIDWSRDGRYVLFRAVEITSNRTTMQAVKPTGGDSEVIAVMRDAGH